MRGQCHSGAGRADAQWEYPLAGRRGERSRREALAGDRSGAPRCRNTADRRPPTLGPTAPSPNRRQWGSLALVVPIQRRDLIRMRAPISALTTIVCFEDSTDRAAPGDLDCRSLQIVNVIVVRVDARNGILRDVPAGDHQPANQGSRVLSLHRPRRALASDRAKLSLDMHPVGPLERPLLGFRELLSNDRNGAQSCQGRGPKVAWRLLDNPFG